LTIVVDSVLSVKTSDELTVRFREEGLRVTPQRECLFRLLNGNDGHPTVDALYEAARAEMPTISLKTVYQTVNDLAAMGEVSLLDVGTGSLRVDPNVERAHHHLVCSGCGMVRDLPVDVPTPHVPAQYRRRFSVDAIEVIFRGRCDRCTARSAVRTSDRTTPSPSEP
jgi:Fe2+ or Zn2+ uptake regulation protein